MSPSPARVRIDLADADRLPLRVANAPLPSLIALLADGYQPRARVPAAWRAAIGELLPPRARPAVAPVVSPRTPSVPDSLVPMPDAHVVPLDEDLDRIVSTDHGLLLDELSHDLGPELPDEWQIVARRTTGWVSTYAAALQHAGRALEPLWREAGGLRERELERVGVAVARGALPELLAGLHPEARTEDGGDGALLLPDYHDHLDLHIGPEGLVLVPMLTGTPRLIVQHRGDRLTHIAYSLPGRDRLLDRRLEHRQPAPDALEALLGPARARVLRQLDRPATAGQVAEALLAAPSAATHHLAVLEKAGLVVRERRGRHVIASRTTRGSELLALYESGS